MAAMRAYAAFPANFNRENMGGSGVGRLASPGYYACPVLGSFEGGRQVIMKTKNVVAALRRDVSFVWHAVIAVMFVGFVSLAVAAALLDVLAIRN
jgi:hypothetical protein